MSHIQNFIRHSITIINKLNVDDVENIVLILRRTREQGGRLFFVGSGGGAGHASHAACDFRKLGGFEAYCPTDNVSELTARINDDGWDTSLANYLKGSKIGKSDSVFVFSVGGGNEEKQISMNLVNAVKIAREVGAKVVGIVGRDGGYTAKHADACVIIPTVDKDSVTPQTEGFQAIVWHMIVSHPDIQVHPMKWESTK